MKVQQSEPRFHVGQLVVHSRFHYRGVVVDVDPAFMHSDAWYEAVADSRPPRDQPWYRVLPHGTAHETYVAQRNLEADRTAERIRHPLLWHYFAEFRDGVYVSARPVN